MVDIKPTVCQLLTSHLINNTCGRTIQLCIAPSSHHFNDCSAKNRLQSECNGTNRYYRTRYSDVPKSSRILDQKRSMFSLKDNGKSMERIFRENSQEYISAKPMINKEPIRHIGLQTDYREESTQTNPFSPAYIISDDGQPEVFTLSDFTYGKGLPATALEISFIERLRARREWEQDRSVDMTRAKLVMEREIREWQMREKEIKMLQDTRHQLFTKNLHTYIDMDEDFTQNRMDLAVYRQEKQSKSKYEQLEIDKMRAIRRLKRIYQLREVHINSLTNYNHLGIIGLTSRGNGCYSSLKPPWHKQPKDILTKFLDASSKSDIPCLHVDNLIDRHMNRAGINISELEELLPKNALIVQTDESIQLKFFENTQNKKVSRHIQDLEKAYQLIQNEKMKISSTFEKKPLRFVEKIEKIDHIQQFQAAPIQTEAHDRRRISMTKLQNYLRSIIVQSRISHISEIRHDLLDELRNGLKSSDDIHWNRLASPRSQLYDYFESETISDMLDFLSKELLRLQCEQTLHLFILSADRIRYQREAAETGSRIRTIEQQKIQDHIFQQMFSLNSDSDIESYIQDLLLQSISDTADEQAKLEIKQITDTLVNLTDQMTHSSDIEAIVADLVHNFLIPTVHKVLLTRENSSKH